MNWRRNFLWVLAFTSLEVLGQISPGTISISGNQTICSGTVHGTLTVTSASGCTGGCSYQWMSSTDGTNFSNISSANGLSYTNLASISANIYYKVSISDGVNPTVETNSFLVSVHELPTVTISATPGLTIPSEASVSLSALLSNAPANYTYTFVWSNSATANPTTVTPAASANYTVTATDQYTCSATSAAVTVTVVPLIGGQIATTPSVTSVCSGSVPPALSNSTSASGGNGVTGDYTYLWQKSTNGTTWTDITTATGASYTPTQAITQKTYFRRKVTNLTKVAYSNELSFEIDALPNVRAFAAPRQVSSGGTIQLTQSAGTTDFAWTQTGGATGLSSTTIANPTATVSAQTTFTLTAKDAKGCSDTGNVTVSIVALLPGSIGGAEDVCIGATPSAITSTAAPSGGSGIASNYTYSWQSATDAGFSQNVNPVSGSSPTLSFSTATSTAGPIYYRRGVVDQTNIGVTPVYTSGVLKTVRTRPTITSITPDPTTSVPENASVQLTAVASGSAPLSYSWTNSANATTYTGATPTVTPAVTTTYTLVVTDNYSCVNDATAGGNTVTITVVPLIGGQIATTPSVTSVCSGSVPPALSNSTSASGGNGVTGDYTYLWQKSTNGTTWTDITTATGASYTPTQAITQKTYFRRKVTNLTKVAYSTEIVFNSNPRPIVSIAKSPSIVPPNGEVSLTGQGATTYEWSENGTSTLQANNTNPVKANPVGQTTYQVIGTDGNGCKDTATTTVSTQATTAGTIDGDEEVCLNEVSGTITSTLSAQGGSNGSFTYKWQQSADGNTWSDINSSNSPSYSPGIISASTYFRRGASDPTLPSTWVYTASAYKELKALPTISISRIPSGNIPSGASVQFTASGAGSSGTYNWSFISTQNPVSQVITGTNTVTISVTGEDANGCQSTTTSTITIAAINPGTITTSSTTVCPGGIPTAITSTSGASGGTGAGYTYEWYRKIGNSGVWAKINGAIGESFTPTTTISSGSTIYYKRRATNAGVFEETLPVTINASTPPNVQLASTATTISSGTTITISSTAPTATDYSWSSGQTTANIQVAPISSSRFVLTITDVNGCTNKDSLDINVVAITPGSISNSANFCEGTAPSAMSITGSSGGSNQLGYQWESSADGISYSNVTGGTGGTTDTYTPGVQNATIYYKVKVYDLDNASAYEYSDPVTRTMQSSPSLVVTLNKTRPIALGSGIEITANGASQYQFKEGTVVLQGYGYTNNRTITPSNTNPTVITVLGRSAQGCITSDTVNIKANTLIVGTISNPNAAICEGTSLQSAFTGTAASGGSGTQTYQWYSGISTSNLLPIGNATSQNYHYQTALTQSTYFRRNTIDQTYSVDGNIILVTVNPKPSVTISKSPNATNNNHWPDGISMTLSATTGMSTYSWSPIAGSNSSITVSTQNATTYNLTVTDANGCENSTSEHISIWTLSPGTLSNQSLCGNGTVDPISATGDGGGSGIYSFTWESSTDNIAFTPIPGVTTASYTPPTPSQTTYYKRNIIDNNVIKSSTATITVSPAPTVTVDKPTATVTTGGTVRIYALGASNYSWSDGSSVLKVSSDGWYDASPTVDPTTYTVTGTDVNNCSNTATSVVSISAFDPGIIWQDSTICSGETAYINSKVDAFGGVGTIQYYWLYSNDGTNWNDLGFDNQKSIQQTLNQDRWYKRRAYNQGVFYFTDPVHITVLQGPSTSVTATRSTIAKGDTTTLSSTGADSYSYSPSSLVVPPSTGISVEVFPSTTLTFTVTGTNSNGCANTDQIEITVLERNPGVIQSLGSTTICPGDVPSAMNFLTPPSAGSGSYTLRWQSSTDNINWTYLPANANTFTPTTPVYANIWYRAEVLDPGTNVKPFGVKKYTNAIKYTVTAPTQLQITSTFDTIPQNGVGNTLSVVGGTVSTFEWYAGTITGTPLSSNSSSFTPAITSTQTTYYLRYTDGSCVTNTSKTIFVSPLVGGVIINSQSLCQGATAGAQITSTSGASGGTQGSYQYQWQESTDQSTWSNITNANDPTFTPTFGTGGLTTDKYYRRKVTNAGIVEYSTVSTVTMIPSPTVGVSASSTSNTALDPNDPIIPNGASITLTGSGTTGMTYAWSPASGLSASSGISVTASPSQTRNYILTGTTVDGCEDTIHIKVRVDALVAGDIEIYNGSAASSSLSICPGDPAPTGSVIRPKTVGGTPTGGSGSYTYQWQYSLDQVAWTSITSAQNTSYNQPTYVLNATFDNITTTRYYRRRVANTGVNSEGNAVQLGVYTRPSVLITSQHDTIPPGGTNVLTASGGGSGTYASYEWHIGTIGSTPAATGATYTLALNGQNNQTTYILRGSDANCSNTFSKTIYVSPLVGGVIDGDQTICQGATTGTTITSTSGASGGTQGSYQYQWQERVGLTGTWTDITGAVSSTYTPTYGSGISGNHYYRRIVTNAGKSSNSNTITVSLVQNPQIIVQASGQTGTTIYIPNGASIQLNASSPSGQPISSYTWSPSTSLSASIGTTVIATPNASTTYTAVGTSSTNCQSQGSITVEVSALNPGSIESAVNSSPNEQVCFGDAPGNMQSVSGQTTSGGSGTYIYQWQRSRDNIVWTDIPSSFNATTTTLDYAPNGNDTLNVARFYRRKVTDMGVSAYSNSVNISIKPDPTIIVSTNKSTVPPGGKVTLTATGGANTNSYTWYKRTVVPTQVGTGTPLNLNIPSTGKYVAYGIGTNGCADSAWLTIQTSPMNSGTIGSDQNLCDGATIQPINNLQSASGGSGTYIYQWYSSTDLSLGYSAILGANQESYTPSSVTQTTYYKRRVTDSEIFKESGVVTITVLPNPVVSASTANRYMPPGGSMNISASGASTYTWTPSTTSQNAANSLVTITGAGAGKTTFTVTGTDGNGCIGSDTIDIYVRNIVAGAISTNQTICSGNLPNAISGIASSGGSGNFSYQWESSTDNVNFSNISGETAVNLSLSTPLSTTTFYRRKTNDQTAFAFSNVVTITVNPSPTLTVSSNKVNNAICQGESITLSALGGSTYNWSTQSGGTVSTLASFTVQPTISTVYSVVGTSSLGCVSNTYTISVSVAPAPVVLVTSDYAQIPPGAQVNLSASGASTYSWSPGTGLSASVGANVTATPGSTTRYIANGINSQGCSDTMSVLVKVLPLNGGTISGTKNVCIGSEVGSIAEVNVANGGTGNGYTYTWEKSTDNINWTTVTGAVTTSPSISDKVTLNVFYRRKVTNLGVTAYSNICTVQPIQRPTVSLSSNKTSIPRGGGITLTASGATTYTLNGPNGQIGTSLPHTATIYTTSSFNAIGVDQNGCSDTGYTIVSVVKLLPGSIGPNQANCEGSSFNPIQNLGSPSGGSGQYTLQWEESLDGVNWNTVASATQLFYSPGIRNQTTYFRRRVFDSGVDTLSANMTISVYSKPQVSALTSHKQVPPGATVTFNATGGVTYAWTGANTAYLSSTTGAPITGQINTTSTYTVNGTDLNGCQDTGNVKVVVVPINGGTIDGTNDVCIGQVPPQIFSTSLATGGSGNFTYEWEKSTDGVTWTAIPGANSTNLLPTSAAYATVFYRRMAVNMGVKQASNVATISVLNKPTVIATSNLSAIPPGASVNLTGAGLAPGGTYSWTTLGTQVGTTSFITVSPSVTTDYILTGTDVNGCSNSDTIEVKVTPLSAGSIVGYPTSLCEGELLDSIGNMGLATGGSGIFAYSWEISSDNINYTTIPNQSGKSLVYSGIITTPKYFRRKVLDNGIDGYTTPVLISVNAKPLVQAIPLNGRYLPPGATVNLNATSGLVSYSWTPTNVLSTTNTRTVAGTLNSTTIFKVIGTDNNGCSEEDTIKIIARPLNAGLISANQIICSGFQPAPVVSQTSASGGSESFTYQWQDSTANAVWNNIAGAISLNYTPAPTAQTMYYRRVVIDNGVTKPTNVVTVSVSPNPAKPIVSDTVICQGEAAFSAINLVSVSNGNSLNWYSTQVGGVASTVSPTISPTNVGQTYYYVSQKSNSTGCESGRARIKVTVSALPNTPIVAASTYRCLGSPINTPLSASANVTSNQVRWYDSDGVTLLPGAPIPNTTNPGTKTYFASEFNPTTGCESPLEEVKVIVYAPIANITVVQNVSCNAGNNGQLSVVASSGLAPYSYTWKKSGANVSIGTQSLIVGLEADIYRVIVSDNRGCKDSASAEVTEPTALALSSTKQDPQCYGNNGSITITASGGTPPYVYSFDNGVTYQSSNTKSLPFGQYQLRVKDANNCEVNSASAVTLNQASAIAAVLTATPTSCFGSADGQISVSASGGNIGTTGYQYQWNDPNLQTTAVATGLIAGAYQVTVYDAVGCSRAFSKTVTSPDSLIVSTVSKQNLTCYNDGSGVITITAFGGNIKSYSIDNGGTSAATGNFTGLDAGTYSITVSDNKSCQAYYEIPQTQVLTQPNEIIVQSIVVDSTSCFEFSDGEIVLSASGGTNLKYSINGGVSYSTNGTFTTLAHGPYTIDITDNNSCPANFGTFSATQNVGRPGKLIVSNLINSNVTCFDSANGQVQVVASGGRLKEYNIDGGLGYQTAPIFLNQSHGSYYLTVKDQNQCPVTYNVNRTFALSRPDSAIVESITANEPLCNGSTNGSIEIIASGGNILTYSINNGVNFSTQSLFTGLGAGEYRILLLDSKGCEVTYKANKEYQLDQPDSVIVTGFIAENSSCYDSDDATIEILAGGGNLLEFSINNGVTWSYSNIFEGLTPGTYTIRVRDVNNCSVYYQSTRTVIITEPDLLYVSNYVITPVSCHDGGDGMIEIMATGGNTRKYSINNGSSYQLDSSFINLTSGNYSIAVSDDKGCLATYNTVPQVYVAQPDSARILSITKQDLDCKNSQDGQISINGQGGNVLRYRIDPGSNYSVSSFYNGLSAGTYFVEIEDSKNCEIFFEPGVTSTQVLTEPDSLTLWEIKLIEPKCSGYTDGSIEITATGGNTKSYSINNGISYQSTSVFTGLSSANYNIKVRDDKFCPVLKKVTTSVLLDQPDSLFVNAINVTDVTCKDFENGEIEILSSGGNTPLSFSIDATKGFYVQSSAFTGLLPGNYVIGVQDANQCPLYSQVPLAIILNEPDSLTLRNIITTQVTCSGDKDGLLEITATGGNWPLTYAISGQATLNGSNPVFSGLEGGNYLVNIIDSNACPLKVVDGLSRYVTLFEPDPLIIREVAKKDITCHNFNDGEITLTVTGGNMPTLYSVNNGIKYSLNPIFDSLIAGAYTVLATDSNNCPIVINGLSVNTLNYSVINPLPLAAITTVNHNVCKDDEFGSVSLNISGGTLSTTTTYGVLWQDGLLNNVGTGPQIDSIGADYYTASITDDNSCLLQVYATVKEPDSLVVRNISFQDSKCYRSMDGWITFDIDGGVGPLASIDSGLTMLGQSTFLNLDTGAYTYHITDVNGCTAFPNAWGQFIINEPDSFYISSAIVKDVDCFGNNSGQIEIVAFGGNLLRYSIDSGMTYQDSAIFKNLYADSYSMQVIDTAGCQGQYSVSNTVTVNEPLPLIGTASIISGVNCQFDTTGVADVAITGGTVPYSILWETEDTTLQVSGLNGFEYEYIITDANLCTFEGTVIVPTTDADCDSIPDQDDGFTDFDFDGIPNYLDTDSDGDGLSDFLERDYNRDGVVYDDCDNDGFPNFLDVDYCDVFIPTVFTPNGDGVNDNLEIPGIDAYPDNILSIFNRNGELVYRMAPYDNSFDGETSRTSIIQNPDGYLPTGTYYYTLEIPSIGVRHIGYLYIQR